MIIMKEVIRKYFIPHEGNEYKPHFFREKTILGFAGFLVLLTFLAVAYSALLTMSGNFLAAVVPPALIELVNDDRASINLAPLKINPVLVLAAELKAQDMVSKNYFLHTSPEGLSPWYWFGKAGYNFAYAGENLAIDFSESSDVNTAWMNSPEHRANILNKNFTEIGIATTKGYYRGRETIFVVQLFGRPVVVASKRSSSATASEPIAPTSAQSPKVEEANVDVIGSSPPAGVEPNAPSQAHSDMFVAVKNLDMPQILQESQKNLAGLFQNTLDSYIGKFYGIITSPNISLAYLYLFLGILVMIALLLMIFIEIKVQRPKHIIYGILLLLLIGGLVYLNISFIAGGVMII